MGNAPSVSIIICTRNRATKLPACLSAIATIRTSQVWELVVVDNGSTDGTRSVLNDFAARVHFPVKIVFEPLPGLGRARNTGWRAAKGTLLGFTDDDCYVATDYVDRVAKFFETEEVGFGAGKVTLFDPTDVPITIQLAADRIVIPPRSFIEPGFLLGANMVFRRRVLEQIGGFDETFGAGATFCPEDIDAEARASFAGWMGVYDPYLKVAHHHGRKTEEAAAAMRHMYSFGTGAYKAKFCLAPATRAIYLRNWYWDFRRCLTGHFAIRRLAWELKGAICYALYRLGAYRRATRRAVP